MNLTNAARFPLSEHIMRTHYSGGESFDNNVEGYSVTAVRRAYAFDESFTGKGVKLAIISALDNVGAEQNLNVFCSEFGLNTPAFSVHYPEGMAENTSRRWLVESSLDTQWAHVFAPDAEILLVFAKDARVDSLLYAAQYAQKNLSADVICMCFGTEESSADETLSSFMEDGGIFVASSGDVGGYVSFPSTSPNCVSVGGTSLFLSSSDKRIIEVAWELGGGGQSDIFEIPPYQGRFFNIYGITDGKRGTPDVSMMANYNPGVPVYVSQRGGWTKAGGTSLSAACFSGVCACIKERFPDITTSRDVLSFLYGKAGTDGYEFPQYNFHDITIGRSGDNYAGKGWDLATGLGSPVISRILT